MNEDFGPCTARHKNYVAVYIGQHRRCAHGLLPGFLRLQPAHPVLKTICCNIRPALLKMDIMMPETR